MVSVTVADYREAARRRLPKMFFEYLDGGSYAELTLRRNVADMEAVALRQRVMRDVSKLSMKTEVLGQEMSMPVGLGPVGFSGMFARRGEVQAAKAAQKAGLPFTLSTVGICSVEEVSDACEKPIWYQLYMIKDRGYLGELLARVAAQQCPVLVFTVDLPVAGARYRDVRSGMSAAPGLAADVNRIWQGVTHPAMVVGRADQWRPAHVRQCRRRGDARLGPGQLRRLGAAQFRCDRHLERPRLGA